MADVARMPRCPARHPNRTELQLGQAIVQDQGSVESSGKLVTIIRIGSGGGRSQNLPPSISRPAQQVRRLALVIVTPLRGVGAHPVPPLRLVRSCPVGSCRAAPSGYV